jgi:ribosome assembly protein 4
VNHSVPPCLHSLERDHLNKLKGPWLGEKKNGNWKKKPYSGRLAFSLLFAVMKRKAGMAAEAPQNIIAQFVSTEGVKTGSPLDLPLNFSDVHLQELLNELLSNDDPLPYSFYVNDVELVRDLKTFLEERKISTETTLEITYQPQAVFRVRPLTRCTSTLPGHTDSVLVVAFNPTGTILASGSGDKTMRLWDLNTQTPIATCVGHTHWVLAVAWAPDGHAVATGSHDNTLKIWGIGREQDGKDAKVTLRGHKKWVTSLAWQPMHRTKNRGCRKLVSSSKDNTAKIWDSVTGKCVTTLSGHSSSVTNVKWGGEGLIYTASQDRTIIVWAVDEENSFNVKIVRQLKGNFIPTFWCR